MNLFFLVLFIFKVLANEEYQPMLTPDFPHLLGIERIRAWMNKTADPCSDFYQYACGGFRKRYATFQNDTDVIGLMSKTNSLLMEMILNRTTDPLAHSQADREIFEKSRNYYVSCARRDVIEQRGYAPFRTMANVMLAKFKSRVSFPRLLGQLQSQSGISIVLQSKYTSVPTKDIKKLRLQFVPAAAYNVTRETISQVFDTFVDNEIIPDNVNTDELRDFIFEYERRHLYFGKHLNHRHKLGGDRPDQFKSIDELSEETGLDWREYLDPLKLPDVEKIHLWAGSNAWLEEIEYVKNIPLHKLKYLALWRLAVTHYNKLPNPYYELWQKNIFKKSLRMGFYSVDTAATFLRHDCVRETGANLKYLSGHLYIKYAFNSTQKEAATKLVDDLFVVLRRRFKELDWMDEASQDAAIKKLDNLEKIVGFPDWVMDSNRIAEYYRPLRLNSNTYFENAVQAQIFTELMPSISHSRKNSNEREGLFKDHMWLLNAVHLVNLVQIQINPGFLQRPLFSARNPKAMNYGSLGGVIGHEITHAFDSYGSLYDANGVRRPWMSRSSRHEFNKRAKCFIDQYNDMSARFSDGHEGYINGRHTLTENIADNGGMHTAWTAWSESETGDIFQKSSDSEFSPAQIFWLSFAQTNCDVESDKKLTRQLKKDVHSPKPVRVNGALRNSMEFAKAFQCELGTRMHPKPEDETCRIL
jgi:predicted metalloendopeptidase